jgi:ELWxxDGT repeat protein
VLFEGVDAAGNNALWLYNGQTVSEITGISGAYFGGLNASELVAFNREVLFNGFNAAGRQGLWLTDGTAGGTHEIAVNGAASGGLNPSDLTVLNQHEVLFEGSNAAGQRGLWETNGTTGGTPEITGISEANSNGLAPTDLTVVPSGTRTMNVALLAQHIASTFAITANGHDGTLRTDLLK